ncbi:MAG: hypothetical protein BM556_02115 [Bacteriovorax sp. MedPE-SWde]|nr:MAG: hypothetical protein BM556_02115 [Bacteriovorax sp. MedPE-SWde]
MENNLKNKTADELVEGFSKYYAREQHDIMSSVAHDVKNPLGIIELSLGLMEDKVEALLEGADEKLEKKIRSFFGNINIGLERCQDILDATLDVQRTDMPDSPDEISDLKEFCDKFYIFAKPKLKRAKISFENSIEEGITITTIPHLLAKSLIHSVSFCAINTASETGSMMNLSYDGTNFIFKLTPKSEGETKLSKLKTHDNDVFNERFRLIREELGADFSIEQDDNSVVAKLGLS